MKPTNPKSRAGRALVNARWKQPGARSTTSERVRAYWASLSPEERAKRLALSPRTRKH